MRRGLVVAAAVVALGLPASAAGQLDRAASSLRGDPVFVAPGAKPTISSAEADRLRSEIRTNGAAPMFIAVLPASALAAGDGTPEGLLRTLHDDVHLPGTYAVVVGGKFRAGATAGLLPQGEAGRLATEAFQEHRQQGVAATLSAFVEAVGAERSGAAP